MTARTSMATLISRVRRLINDPGGADETWSDDEIEDWLDAHCIEVIQEELLYTYKVVGGVYVVLDYAAERGDWESSAVLTDTDGATLTPATSDYQTGRWTFTSDQCPPVYLTGKSYDIYAAAADALEARSAMVALDYDFSADGASYQRSQPGEALLRLARQYRARSRPAVARMVRDDAR